MNKSKQHKQTREMDLAAKPKHRIVGVGHEPDCFDDWVIYWTDGTQVAGHTFTQVGGTGVAAGMGYANPCAYIHGGPGHDVDPRLTWNDVPESVREAANRVMQEWDASIEEVLA